MPSTNSRRLYALLVAINDYPAPVPPLRGCVNDIQKVASYLRKESETFEVNISQLVNGEATKDNIVNTFLTHFRPAGINDVALFYFSGHGTQEEADPLFWTIEEDRKLESIVCYDSYTMVEGEARFRLLADKEIRYLISKLAINGAHIVTIFDCCHSGGNTRNGFIGEAREDIRERRFIFRERLSQAFPRRNWKDFIFSETVSLEDAKKNSLANYLPEGKHIQMAACQNDESAFEVSGEGVFTKNLLEILDRSEGSVTYYDLQARIQNYLRYQFRQTPKTYVVGEDESSLFVGFLNKQKEQKPLYGNVSYNETSAWIIDFGSMHGLTTESTIKVMIQSNRFIVAGIKELYSNHAHLVFEKKDAGSLDRNLSYRGYTTDYFSALLAISVNIREPSKQQALIDGINSSLGNQVIIAKDEGGGDYCITESDNKIFISRPSHRMIPVVQPLDSTAGSLTDILTNYIQHLSQFEFVKGLQNPNTFLFNSDPIEIVFYQKNDSAKEEPMPIKDGDVRPDFRTSGGTIRIKLRNKSDRKLYCALLYLSFNFGVHVKMFKDVVVGLEPNAEVWVLDGSEIGLKLEEEVIRYNYKESVSTLKLIVSTSDFKQQAVRFEMPSLPSPLVSGFKGLDVLGLHYNPGQIDDWLTRNINIKIKNPDFKPSSYAAS